MPKKTRMVSGSAMVTATSAWARMSEFSGSNPSLQQHMYRSSSSSSNSEVGGAGMLVKPQMTAAVMFHQGHHQARPQDI